MKCGYYCDGYCFWNGDTGEVCDKIAYGTHKRIKDGYCPKEQNDRELEEHAEWLIKQQELEELCNKYLSGMQFVAKLYAAMGGSCYCAASNDRADIHEKICTIIGKEHYDKGVLEITNNLDKHIGFNVDANYTNEEVAEYAKRLASKLLELPGAKL